MDLLCRLLVSMEMTPPTESGLYVDGCAPALVGRMSEDRLALIRTVSTNYCRIMESKAIKVKVKILSFCEEIYSPMLS